MPDRAATAVLHFVCADRPGIVARVSTLLFEAGANILDADQHADAEAGVFFLRVEWEMADGELVPPAVQRGVEQLGVELDARWELFTSQQPLRMAIMVSKYDHCLYDLLVRHRDGQLPSDVVLVLSNHPDLEPVARHFGVPFAAVAVSAATRLAAEAEQLRLLALAGTELVVLARYMQILSPAFVAAYPNRIINIHHSFLPAFIGASPYRQAHARGVKVIGATAHYVTDELDQGPIIEQAVARVSHRDRVSDLVVRGQDQERLALAYAVRMHLEHRVLCYGNKTVVFE